MHFLLRLLPKRQMSYIVGRLSFMPLPRQMSQLLIRWFVRKYSVKVDEAAQDLESYRTLGEFFIRDLKPGVRSIGEGVVSPVDGAITQCGAIEEGQILQVKGFSYAVRELLGDEQLAQKFQNGTAITFYLSPRDYHHIHAPVSGLICRLFHIEGTLWPVNRQAVLRIRGVFCQNERVVTVIEGDAGFVAVVKVGALNVGSITVCYDSIRTNRPWPLVGKGKVHQRNYSPALAVKKGERLGTFRFGSTVVVLFERGKFAAGEKLIAGPVCLGASIGREVS